MKILIGYDGSKCADDALAELLRAGLPDDAHALVLTVADVFLPPETGDDPDEGITPHSVLVARARAKKAFADAQQLAGKAAAEISKLFSGWTVDSETRADTPHWAIIAKSEEWKPDLVVVGSQGRSALGRLVIGSVSQKVLYETSCSVRIARGRSGSAEPRPARLILATDGSSDADAMVESVASRRWPSGTQVKLVTAYETSHTSEVDPDVLLNSIWNLQALATESLTDAGLAVEQLVTGEDPKRYLVRLAEEWDADCIFLGAKGHRFFERLMLGSVSSAVAARSHCSVEVVRRPNANVPLKS